MATARLRLDGWQNALTGLGTSSDKIRATTYGTQTGVSFEQLRRLYDGDWLASRIVDAVVSQALRKGYEAPEAEEAQQRFHAINHTTQYPKGLLQFALRMGRLEAGCGLLLGVRSRSPLKAPLAEGAELEWLEPVRRDQAHVVETDSDENSGTYGQPTLFRLQNDHPRTGLEVHASRILWCEGREVAGRENESNWISDLVIGDGMPFWGSVLQPVYDTIGRYGTSWNAVSHMLQEASIAVFTMKGLIDMLTSEDESVIADRFLAMNRSRSVAKMIALDSDGNESYERSSVSFADVPQLMSEIMNDVAGAAEIPATILFGVSPSGLNATGESDLQQWYDRIYEYRTTSVEPKLQRLLELCGAPAQTSIEFPALWEPTEQQAADTQTKRATTDRIYWDLGAFSEDEIRNARGVDVLGLTEQEAAKPLSKEEPVVPATIPAPPNETPDEGPLTEE